jgi:hypothetical protein
MAVYRVCIVGGWCGNRMVMVAEYLNTLLESRGFPCRVFHHSVWDNTSQPPASDLVLQLLQAFTPEEAGAPVINIRRMLVDLDDGPTLEKIFTHVQATYAQGQPSPWRAAVACCGTG